MSHFSSKDWFEFARGLGLAELKERMQQHLDSGCDRCDRTLQLWRSTLEVAARVSHYEPFEHIVRGARAAFETNRPWTHIGPLANFARLVSDSLRQPSLAGVRSAVAASQQLVYEAEPFVIDLRLQSEPSRQRISLIGQILNATKPNRMLEGVEVLLLSEDREIAKNTTNAQGEFEFEFGSEEKLQLHITIHGQKAVGIILPGRQGSES